MKILKFRMKQRANSIDPFNELPKGDSTGLLRVDLRGCDLF